MAYPSHEQYVVVNEQHKLDKKVNELTDFIRNNKLFKKLDDAEQLRLCQQEAVMRTYSRILGERITAFT